MPDYSRDRWEVKASFGPTSEITAILKIDNSTMPNVEPSSGDMQAMLSAMKALVTNVSPDGVQVTAEYIKYVPPAPESF